MTTRLDIYAETPTSTDDLHDPFALQRDALSDVLELIRVRGNTVFTCAAEPPFGISFAEGKHRLHIIRSGSVVISVDGLDEVFHASQGDLVMLMHAHGHTISDQPGRDARSLVDLAQREYDRERLVLGRGDTTWLCGDFGFDSMLAHRVLSV